MAFICAIRGHKPDRHRAWHDSMDWRSTCIRCGTPMIKDALDQKWRPYDPEGDFLTDRQLKPPR